MWVIGNLNIGTSKLGTEQKWPSIFVSLLFDSQLNQPTAESPALDLKSFPPLFSVRLVVVDWVVWVWLGLVWYSGGREWGPTSRGTSPSRHCPYWQYGNATGGTSVIVPLALAGP